MKLSNPLTSSDWEKVRLAWEMSDKWGAQWLIDAYGLPVSVKELREKFKAEGWKKIKMSKRPSVETIKQADATRDIVPTEENTFTPTLPENPEEIGKYRAEFRDRALQYTRCGLTMQTIADLFQVSTSTLYRWMKIHPAFGEAMTHGRALANVAVVNALFMSATGFTKVVEKAHVVAGDVVVTPITEHVNPNPQSIQFWLTNRDPDNWKARVENKDVIDASSGPTEAELDELYEEAYSELVRNKEWTDNRAERLRAMGVNIDDVTDIEANG